MRFDIFYRLMIITSINDYYNHYEKTPMVTKIAVEIQKLPNYFENHKVKCND